MTTQDERDLVLERVVDVSPELLFKAWTTPEHLMPWFCPKPYRTIECEIDLRPGGRFLAQMVDPDGNKLPTQPGCYLEIVPSRRCWYGPRRSVLAIGRTHRARRHGSLPLR